MIVLGIIILILVITIVYQALCLTLLRNNEKFNLINVITKNKTGYRRTLRIITARIIPIETIVASVLAIIFVIIFVIEYILAGSLIASMLGGTKKDENCECYCKCTRDSKHEYLSNYRWIFGEQAYLEMLKTIYPENEAITINSDISTTGYEKDKALYDYLKTDQYGNKIINSSTLEVFRKHATRNSNFNNLFGKSRVDMTDEQLKDDFIGLLLQKRNKCVTETCEVCDKNIRRCAGIPRYIESKGYNVYGNDDDDPWGDDDPVDGYVPGMASGDYAIQLDDGSYFWYNQGNPSLGNFLPEGTRAWDLHESDLAAGKNHLGRVGNKAGNGCGIYTLAIMVSNLTGKQITVHDILMDMDSQYLSQYNGYLLSSVWFANCVDIRSYYNFSSIAEKYGLGCEMGKMGINGVDKLYNEHKYCYIMFHQNTKSSWYSGDNHFLAIRKRDSNGNYYCFNSVGGANNYKSMNTPMSREELSRVAGGNFFIAFYKDDYGSSGPGGSEDLNIDGKLVYDKLIKSEYSNKAKSLAFAYQCAKDIGFSDEAAIGLMANICHEGDSGIVERSFSMNSRFGFVLPSGRGDVIKTNADKQYLLNWPTSVNSGSAEYEYYYNSKGEKKRRLKNSTYNGITEEYLAFWACGVGCIQWSGGRRITYLNNLTISGSQATYDELVNADILTFKSELASDYYRDLVNDAIARTSGTAENYAEAFCDYYVMPGGADLNMSNTGDSCRDRRATATKLANILK